MFTDVPVWLAWATPEIEEAYRLGLVHGTGPNSLFGPQPDGWSGELWDATRLQKATTICLVVRLAQPWRTVVKMRKPSIVRIEGAGIATAWAAGRMNGNSVLITAAHAVLDDQGHPTAGFAQWVPNIESGVKSPKAYSIVDISQEHDIAVITDPWSLPPIPLAQEEARQGDWLVAIGCGAGLPGRPTPFMAGTQDQGTVLGVTQPLMADSARAQDGDSGGPVLDMAGAVVHMISNTKPGDSMTNTLPLSVLRRYFTSKDIVFSL